MELMRFPEQVLNHPMNAQRTTDINTAPFPAFPVEVLELIFDHVSVFDWCALALTCRRFATIVVRNNNCSFTWHHNVGLFLRTHNTTWLCMHDDECPYTKPATVEMFTELLWTLPCVLSGFKDLQYFVERSWPDMPTWIELKYCTRCVEFRPQVCIERVLGSRPGNQSQYCMQGGSDGEALIDSRTWNWANEDPIWFQEPATRYEPLFRRGVWHLEEIPSERQGAAQVCPACRDKKPQAAEEEDDVDMYFRLTKRTDTLGLRRLLGGRRMQPEKDAA